LILDSSAIVGIIGREAGHEALKEALARAETLSVGAPTLVESGLVLVGRHGIAGRQLLERLIEDAGVQVTSFDRSLQEAALDAFLRFGKGRHRARLNYGDCMTYAVAKLAGEPLLCVGDDFARTDLEIAR